MFNTVKKTVSLAVLVVCLPTAVAAQVDELVNLTTTESGIYSVNVGDLAANRDVDIIGEAKTDISLMSQGQAVAVHVTGSAVLDAQSTIYFIADKVDTLYTDTNVYTLSLGGEHVPMSIDNNAMPQRTAAATSYIRTQRFAPQAAYSFTSPDKGDPWYAKRMVAVGSATSESVVMELEDVAVGGNQGRARAKLKVDLWGGANQPGAAEDHSVKVSFNGNEVASKRFDGLKAEQVETTLDEVRVGRNVVRVDVPLDTGYGYDVVNMNSVEVSYPSKFVAKEDRLDFVSTFTKFRIQGFSANALENGAQDLMVIRRDSSGTSVVQAKEARCRGNSCMAQIAGAGGVAHYYVSSQSAVRAPGFAALPMDDDITSSQANYLIISHPDFIGAAGNNHLENLATDLASEMGSVAIVDVESIYAQFGHHLFDPTAIRDYIEYAHANRGTNYVLLVGGDVYDYRQFENEDATSFIPSLYAATGNNITFAPVDAKYVDLNNDNVPDLPIGRLPVRTVQQLGTLLTKRTDYINRDYTGKVLLVADDYDVVQQYDFKADAEEVQANYLSNFDVQKAYVDDIGTSAARAKVRDEINQGTTLTAFFGHSSTNQWSFDGLFTGPDAASLSNQGKPTVVTQWGCWNTYFVSPNEDSMGHRFMMEGDRGAVAVMGASTLTNADAERKLARLVFDRLGNGERLGDAVTNAKQEYALENPNDLDVLLGWTLLGLPDLVIN